MSNPVDHATLEQLHSLVVRALSLADDMEMLETGIALDSARLYVEAAMEAPGATGGGTLPPG